MRIHRVFVFGLFASIFIFSMFLWLKWPANNNPDKIHIILLTYSRSGSSLLGEILSSTNDASYIFEPLFYPCQQLEICNEIPHHYYIDQLLNCDGETLHQLIHHSSLKIVRKLNSKSDFSHSLPCYPEEIRQRCQMDSIQVIKTIRLRVLEVVKLLQNHSAPNLKVVHLFRDPRARYHSLQTGGNWDEKFRSMDTVCKEMEIDLKNSIHLPEHIYTRIRYEDVVQDPFNRVQRLFNRLYNRKLDEQTVNYISTHMATVNDKIKSKKSKNYYYVTYRNSLFDPNRWMKRLNLTSIKLIEKKCEYVMKELGYQMFNVEALGILTSN
ncbi:hypothetical protein CHUAL_006755 [Chamberlinius hualienensis]